MIIGIGIDLVEIERVEKACEQEAFFTRCFTAAEQGFLREIRATSAAAAGAKAAGNFAVKEAVSKAFGTGVRGFSLNEIEVLRDSLGAPVITLYGNALQLAAHKGITHWHVSISNTKNQATAMVIAERREQL